mgnify:FL=1
MAAAENDALPRGKVGGIGDVVRDIPIALAEIGQEVDVVVPGYGSFSKLAGAQHVTSLNVMFGGQMEPVDVFKIKQVNATKNVSQWIIEHPLFAIGGEGKIYCDDAGDRPFSSDAQKFSYLAQRFQKRL